MKVLSTIARLRMRPDIQGVSAMIQNILLAAHRVGYGTCRMVTFNVARHDIENDPGIRPPGRPGSGISITREGQTQTLDGVIKFIR